MPWLLFLLALLAGAANPFQSGTNAQLNKQIQQPVLAGLFVYATGFVALLLFQLLRHHTVLPETRLATVNWWAWLGGFISIIPTIVGLTIAQKMGAGVFTGCSLTASLITSVLLDQFGLVGFRQHSASPARCAGCCCLVAGIWLVARF